MAIKVDTSSNSGRKTGNNYTWSHTTSATANLLVVCTAIHSGGAGRDVTGITYGGQALSLANKAESDPGISEIWYIVNPPSGANNVIVTFGTNPTEGAASATSLLNADIANVVYATADGNTSGTPSTTINGIAGGIIFDSLAINSTSALTPGTGQTEIMEVTLTDGSDKAGSSYKLPVATASTTMTWNVNATHTCCAATFKARDEGGAFLLTQL